MFRRPPPRNLRSHGRERGGFRSRRRRAHEEKGVRVAHPGDVREESVHQLVATHRVLRVRFHRHDVQIPVVSPPVPLPGRTRRRQGIRPGASPTRETVPRRGPRHERLESDAGRRARLATPRRRRRPRPAGRAGRFPVRHAGSHHLHRARGARAGVMSNTQPADRSAFSPPTTARREPTTARNHEIRGGEGTEKAPGGERRRSASRGSRTASPTVTCIRSTSAQDGTSPLRIDSARARPPLTLPHRATLRRSRRRRSRSPPRASRHEVGRRPR